MRCISTSALSPSGLEEPSSLKHRRLISSGVGGFRTGCVVNLMGDPFLCDVVVFLYLLDADKVTVELLRHLASSS
jgi:hypothetical protein